jgi:putative SOS response-associated peptidase YedK
MCGAFGITTPENILERFEVEPFGKLEPRYNIRPTQETAIITRNSPNSGHIATFGFIPSWNKDVKPKFMPINARSETIAITGMFKHAFEEYRCLIPATHYYEWQKFEFDGKPVKQPYLFKPKDQQLFSIAGIYSIRKDSSGIDHYTFAVITTKPNDVAKAVHDRMPVILHQDDEDTWLDKNADTKELMHLMIPYENDQLETYKVSQEVNSARNDNERLTEPV